jgi:hypothetical protein
MTTGSFGCLFFFGIIHQFSRRERGTQIGMRTTGPSLGPLAPPAGDKMPHTARHHFPYNPDSSFLDHRRRYP